MADNNGCSERYVRTRYGSYELASLLAYLEISVNHKTSDGKNRLHFAALYGHLNHCKTLIDESNFDVYIPDNDGWTALHFSARNGSYDLVSYFAEIGTDIHLKTKLGWNCLHIAALYGHLNLCKILIHKHKFDALMSDDGGWTAIHYSARNGSYELLKYFADDPGTDIALQTNDGINCLHIATLYGHSNLCKKLIDEHNFDVHLTDNDGWAALHYSARNGSYALVTYFADMGTNVYLKTNDGSNCLHIAALYGHLNLCKKLIDKHKFDLHMADSEGWTALHYSARNGSYELLTYLADKETDFDIKSNSGWNWLHLAALCGHLHLCKKLINRHNFNPYLPDNEGWTAFHFSASNGSYELLSYFFDIGTDIDLKTNSGWNCLHIAALYGHLSLCKALICKLNFDLHINDNDGWTALHYSARNGSYELLTYFADTGTDIYLQTNDGSNCLHVAALWGHLNLCDALIVKKQFDVNIASNDGWTILHYTARNGSYELFKYFTDIGVDIDIKTNLGWNCLHIAALYGHLNLCKKLIENHNFDVHVTDDDGWTALHHSPRSGSYELVTYFTEMGTDIHVKNNSN